MRQYTQIFILAFLVTGFLLLVPAQKGFAGFSTVVEPFCCLSEGGCVDNRFLPPDVLIACEVGTVEENAICNENTGSCVSLDVIHEAIPTVSEWGLIALAGILGIVGFTVLRGRKAAA